MNYQKSMNKKIYLSPLRTSFLFFTFTSFIFLGSCQQTTDSTEEDLVSSKDEEKAFTNTQFHQVTDIVAPEDSDPLQPVRNIILMIGDGMGTSQVFAGMVANKGKLNINHFKHGGFAITKASDNDITDSAAGATAMACGIKTYNGAIGVDSDGNRVDTILELAEQEGKSTGLVATCRITHATPASFIAHQPSRSMYDDIAMDFLRTDVDLFIGGGRMNFSSREDSANLLDSLKEKGYHVVTSVDSLEYINSGKLAGLIHEEDQERYSEGRGNMLEKATAASLRLLSQNDNGFFLMIEGSQIDWGGHANNTTYLVEEMLDFDRAIGQVLEFASSNPGTLVIVTADHETGGFSIIDADANTGFVEGGFSTGSHTGVMVPVYAFGSHAETFNGTYQNTEIFYKMRAAFGL